MTQTNTPSKEKTIDTLIKDIYETVDKGTAVSPEDASAFGESLSALVVSRLSSDRQPGGYLRPSNMGEKCDRRLWYQINRPEAAEALAPVTRLKFLLGDVIEALVLFLAKASGHTVEGEQTKVEIDGVVGSRDAVIDGTLVDVKSASTYSFEKFRNGLTPRTDDFGYLSQIGFYHDASLDDPVVTDKDRAAFLAMDKQHAKLALDVHYREDRDWSKIIADKRKMLASPSVPPRGFSDVPQYTKKDPVTGLSVPSGPNRKLGTKCSYCEFKHTCWPGLRTFLYSGGPQFLTHVGKLPDVTEVNT